MKTLGTSPTRPTELDGAHIGRVITFTWNFPEGIRTEVIGELREVHHDAEGTTVWIAAHTGNAVGKREFVLDSVRPIHFVAE